MHTALAPDETMTCPACKGAGGTFEDVWRRGAHTTIDYACDGCGGSGEMPAECECGGPAVARMDADGSLACARCLAEIVRDDGQAPVSADRIPTAPEGVPVTMARLVFGDGADASMPSCNFQTFTE
jgi:hypothetical protein